MAGGFLERRYRSQDGLSLYFRDYGPTETKRPVILCLAGLARNAKDAHPIATQLADRGYRVISPDYRGRGQSDYASDPMTYTPETYIDDIRHLLTALNIHRVVVIGTSLGGLLAMGMGAAMPTVLAGAVLNDVGPDIPPGGMGRILTYLSNDPMVRNWDAATEYMKTTFPQLGYVDEDDWRRAADNTFRTFPDGQIRYDWDPEILVPIRKNRPLPDLWALYRSLLHKPVLAVRGALSDILMPETFEKMAAAKPDLMRISVPKVGHVPSLTEPVAQDAIDAFLTAFE